MNRPEPDHPANLAQPLSHRGSPVLRSLFGVALLTLAACNNDTQSTPDSPPGATTSAPTAGEQLRILPPKGWQLTASSNRGNFRRARYVRTAPDTTDAAATPDSVESLTFEYLDPNGLPDPIQFLEAMAAEQNERCEAFSSRGVGAGLENGYASAVRLLSCPYRKVNKSSTVSLAKAIAGNDGYYLIVFEKRAPSQRTETGWDTGHVTEDDIATWSLYLRRTTVCDTERPAHPCD